MKNYFTLLFISITIISIFLLGCSSSTITYSTSSMSSVTFFDFSNPDSMIESGDIGPSDYNPLTSATGNVWLITWGGETPAIKDYGEVSLSTITTVVPSEIVTSNTPIMTYNHSYVVRTSEGNYGKFRVTNTPNIESLYVTFEYYYQSDGSTTFSQ